jgi:hypothetical protein
VVLEAVLVEVPPPEPHVSQTSVLQPARVSSVAEESAKKSPRKRRFMAGACGIPAL